MPRISVPLVALLAVATAGFNIVVAYRNHRLTRDLQRAIARARSEYLHKMIDGMEDVAAHCCDFCNLAMGKVSGEVGMAGGPTYVLTADEERDGKHQLRGSPDGPTEIPCKAAKLREITREMFVDYMKSSLAS